MPNPCPLVCLAPAQGSASWDLCGEIAETESKREAGRQGTARHTEVLLRTVAELDLSGDPVLVLHRVLPIITHRQDREALGGHRTCPEIGRTIGGMGSIRQTLDDNSPITDGDRGAEILRVGRGRRGRPGPLSRCIHPHQTGEEEEKQSEVGDQRRVDSEGTKTLKWSFFVPFGHGSGGNRGDSLSPIASPFAMLDFASIHEVDRRGCSQSVLVCTPCTIQNPRRGEIGENSR